MSRLIAFQAWFLGFYGFCTFVLDIQSVRRVVLPFRSTVPVQSNHRPPIVIYPKNLSWFYRFYIIDELSMSIM